MESMLNKLKSTVTKVTADVTSAVMGNPVTREFEVGRHIASGGPGMSWRIYNGTKKSTKQVNFLLNRIVLVLHLFKREKHFECACNICNEIFNVVMLLVKEDVLFLAVFLSYFLLKKCKVLFFNTILLFLWRY